MDFTDPDGCYCIGPAEMLRTRSGASAAALPSLSHFLRCCYVHDPLLIMVMGHQSPPIEINAGQRNTMWMCPDLNTVY